MESLLLLTIVISYFSLSSKIIKVYNKLNDTSRKVRNLNELIGKEVKVTIDGNIWDDIKGKLNAYDDIWIEIESINKKQQREIKFYKIQNIETITVINESEDNK